jgi:subtilase family serine protease
MIRLHRCRLASFRPAVEMLEGRCLLSTVMNLLDSGPGSLRQAPVDGATLTAAAFDGPATDPDFQPGGFVPIQIQEAYRVSQLLNAGTDGAGQTIAIVVAYNDPNILSDANTFNEAFNSTYNPDSKGYDLPLFNHGAGGPTLTVVNQTGGSTLPAGTDATWTFEASIDVEWAHAIAPKANILLVETTSNYFTDLFAGVQYAAQHANIVSMSWGAPEFSYEATYDSFFEVPNVTFLASAGDLGAHSYYPSASPYVLSVGGTTLTLDGSAHSASHYDSESAWADGGGGPSPYEGLPSYQNNIAISQSYHARTTPDVSMVADHDNSPLAVYDSTPFHGHVGWDPAGGTSITDSCAKNLTFQPRKDKPAAAKND